MQANQANQANQAYGLTLPFLGGAPYDLCTPLTC